MSHPVQLSDHLYDEAKRHASVNSRSIPKQIEYWSRIGKLADENPDLPYAFIKSILTSKQETEDGHVTDYQFG